jgi:hypothetical protein
MLTSHSRTDPLNTTPIFTTNVDLHALAYSISLNLAAAQPSKLKSKGRKFDHAYKKQKIMFSEYKPTNQPAFEAIQPIDTTIGQEPLTHVERWRMHTWHWPEKVTKCPPHERINKGKKRPRVIEDDDSYFMDDC